MIRLVMVASLLVGCRLSLESAGDAGDNGTARTCTVSTTSQPCMDSVTHSDLAWIETKIFNASCVFSGCHNGTDTLAGRVDLRPGMSRAHLVSFSSVIEPTRKLVVPNDVAASYLMLMLRDVPPAMASPPGSPPPSTINYMPQSSPPLCCQKLDALERWINNGAPNN